MTTKRITWADVASIIDESLLTDLQHTTEVLRRTHLSNCHNDNAQHDLEPIYQEQKPTLSSRHTLDSVEQMLDSYSESRRMNLDGSVITSQISPRPTVQTFFNQLDHRSPPNTGSGVSSTYSVDHVSSVDSSLRSPSQLDSMLGTLQKDMSKHGISTIPKGDCAGCGKSIVGQVVIALGKMWHPEHYVCCQCGEELGHRNFFERSGRAYCENDYHDLFSPRCAYCNGPIKDKCVTALGKTFHTEHFACADCGRQFGTDGFHEKDGVAYCKDDFFRKFAPRCNGCHNPIKMNFITALGTHWHPECFICQECGQQFDAGSFYENDGVPLCEIHYHEKRGSLCVACSKPINGRCVSAMGQKFHPEHFQCSYCRKQLNKGTFKEFHRKPLCHLCYKTVCV